MDFVELVHELELNGRPPLVYDDRGSTLGTRYSYQADWVLRLRVGKYEVGGEADRNEGFIVNDVFDNESAACEWIFSYMTRPLDPGDSSAENRERNKVWLENLFANAETNGEYRKRTNTE